MKASLFVETKRGLKRVVHLDEDELSIILNSMSFWRGSISKEYIVHQLIDLSYPKVEKIRDFITDQRKRR